MRHETVLVDLGGGLLKQEGDSFIVATASNKSPIITAPNFSGVKKKNVYKEIKGCGLGIKA